MARTAGLTLGGAGMGFLAGAAAHLNLATTWMAALILVALSVAIIGFGVRLVAKRGAVAQSVVTGIAGTAARARPRSRYNEDAGPHLTYHSDADELGIRPMIDPIASHDSGFLTDTAGVPYAD